MPHLPSPSALLLADHEVLPRLASLVESDRATTAEMLVLIGRAEARRLCASSEYPSLFRYCVGRLRMSEDMAWKRIQAARAARKFPAILAMLADGRLHLTAVVRLAPHLTRANAGELLRAAANLSKQSLEELLAVRFPRPDLAERVQVLVAPAMPPPPEPRTASCPPESAAAAAELVPEPVTIASPCSASTSVPRLVPEPVASPAPVASADLLARITPLSPGRFGVQFTFGQVAHEKLRYAQALASHVVPGGALAEILERALDAYIAKLEKQKFAATARPRSASQRPSADPRHIPAAVMREVCLRDESRCTFTSEQGQRCESREFLEFDHVIPVAKGGASTADNLRLLCRTHNQYAAERALGSGFMERRRAEPRLRAEKKRAAARAKGAESARSEAHARELGANAEAQARALEVMPWLRAVGGGDREVPRAAGACEALPDASLEACVPHAPRVLVPSGTRREAPEANAVAQGTRVVARNLPLCLLQVRWVP